MEDIKIDMVKPIDLPQMAGPLSKLDARSSDLNVVKYPSDLGNATSGRNNKNHWVSFRIYDIEPAGIQSEGRSTAGEATLALPTAGPEIAKLADMIGNGTGSAIIGAAVGAKTGGLGGAIAGANTAAGIGSASTTTAQIGYAGSNWGMALAYNYSNRAFNIALNDFNASYFSQNSSALGFSAYWQPKTTGFIPSISAGVGSAYYSYNGAGPSSGTTTTTWQVALQWNDAFIKGNALGMSYGDTQTGGNVSGPSNTYEVFYKFQVTDNIAVTPAYFWIQGGATGGADTNGGIIKTTFKF
jgi:hypothetical protein